METIGRYQIIAELGRGGMAVVYRALDPNIGREVALKFMSREFLADPEFHHRFEREARAIGALESSAIVPLHDFGEDKGQPYLVMRLMTGGSLVERLRQGAMSVAEASEMLNRLAEALDEAHSKGIIHRDLKPGNILLDHKGAPYLADFGIVKLLESSSMTSRGAIGTPAYMSPEHFEGEVSAQSDIYALGVITFQLLTGKLPFQARTPSEWLKAHLMNTPLSLQQVNNTLPLALQPIIERALAKKPEDRFQSAGELARAVSAVASQPISRSASQRSASQPVSQSASQRPASQPISQSASQRPASQPISQSASQRPASQPVSQSASQRYENKPTVMNTPPGVVSRPASQPMTKPPPQKTSGIAIMLLLGALLMGILLMGGIGLFFFFRSNTTPATVGNVVVTTVDPTMTPSPTATPLQAANPTINNNPIVAPTVEVAAQKADTLTELPGSNPVLTEPQNGSTLTNNQADPIVLRWSGRDLNAANGEQFVIFIRDKEGHNVPLPDKGVTSKAEYILPLNLKVGTYSWLVVVQKKKADNSGFEDVNRSPISSFTIRDATIAAQPQPEVEATPLTVVVAKRPAAVYLQKPEAGQSFAGETAEIQFEWSPTALAENEYYVLIINHREGEERIWVKSNQFPIPPEKRWLMNMGPDLRWQVVIAQKRTSDPNEDPRGAERSEWGQERKFSWAVPVAGSKSSKDNGGSGGSGGGPTTSD